MQDVKDDITLHIPTGNTEHGEHNHKNIRNRNTHPLRHHEVQLFPQRFHRIAYDSSEMVVCQ